MKLQDFGWTESDYERPTRGWECGHTAEGSPCRIGPGPGGRCIATFECFPRKTQKGWVCTRHRTHGGRCEGGPLPDGTCCRPIPPCVPRPTLRARRARWAAWALAGAVGLLLVFLAERSSREWFFSPGEVTMAHALVSDCASCHAAAADEVGAWLSVAPPHGDSAACTLCHQVGVGRARDAFEAHGVPKEVLAHLRDGESASGLAPLSIVLADAVSGAAADAGAGVACATCHQEHRGRMADLTEVADASCQVCHAAQFRRFDRGHPEFAGFPFRRRPPIAFDHDREAHQRDCASCHALDPGGARMVLRGFDAACATCHGVTIAGGDDLVLYVGAEGAEPTPFMEIAARMAGGGASIGDGPDRYLLAFDWLFADLVRTREETPAGRQEEGREGGVSAAAKRVAAVAAAAGAGPTSVQEGPRGPLDAAGRAPDPRVWAAGFTEAFPTSAIAAARSSWFGEGSMQDAAPDHRPMVRGEAYLLAEDRSIRYGVRGHADPLMRHWLDLAAWSVDPTEAAALVARIDGDARRCTRCHSVERSGAAVLINWSGRRSDGGRLGFTRFAHRPHLTEYQERVRGSEACEECHTRREAPAAAPARYLGPGGAPALSPASTTGDFAPQHAEACARCHGSGGTSQSCTLCHRYHAGGITTAVDDRR